MTITYMGLESNRLEMEREGFTYMGYMERNCANQLWEEMPPWCRFFFITTRVFKKVEVWVKE